MKQMLFAVILAGVGGLFASPVKIEVSCDHDTNVYAPGETATLTVRALEKDGTLCTNGTLSAWLDNFGPTVSVSNAIDLAVSNPFVLTGSRATPGFLRLTVTGGEIANPTDRTKKFVWGVAYAPEKILPRATAPADFDAFWTAAKARLEKEVPLDPQVEKDEKRSASDTRCDWYHVSFATFGTRVYGWMTLPKGEIAPHSLAAEVQVPGAGFGNWSQKGFPVDGEATLFLTVFPFPPQVDLSVNQARFDAFQKSVTEPWQVSGYQLAGIAGEKVEDYYYYPVILGINRAVDWFARQDFIDPKRISYWGTSQGGWFGLMLMALNDNFSHGTVFVPAGTGHFAHIDGGQDGWPQIMSGKVSGKPWLLSRNAAYYDGANFAARIVKPIRFAVGYSDCTCAPHAVYSAFNVCPSADKAIVPTAGMGHFVYGPVYEELRKWDAKLHQKK